MSRGRRRLRALVTSAALLVLAAAVRGDPPGPVQPGAPGRSPVGPTKPVRPVQVDPYVEGEAMKVHQRTGGTTSIQDMEAFGTAWSDWKQLFWRGGRVGDVLELRFTTSAQGTFRPTLHVTMAPDYGVVSARLDGGPAVAFDGFAEHVVLTRVEMPAQRVEAQVEHRLELQLVPRHPLEKESSGGASSPAAFVGLDRIVLHPLDRSPSSAGVTGGRCVRGGAHVSTKFPTSLPRVPRGESEGWRECKKCGVVFWRWLTGNTFGGACSVLGNHGNGSKWNWMHETESHGHNLGGTLYARYAVPSDPARRWHLCQNCRSLHTVAVIPGLSSQPCPSGGPHVPMAGEPAYALDSDPDPARARFRRCTGCAMLFDPKTLAGCPVHGQHQAAAGEAYAFVAVPDQADLGFARCGKCRALYFAQPPRNAGVCPAGGPHDAAGSAAYVLRLAAGASPWTRCVDCSTLFSEENAPPGDLCPAETGFPSHRDSSVEGSPPHTVHSPSYDPVPLVGFDKEMGWYRCEKCNALFHPR